MNYSCLCRCKNSLTSQHFLYSKGHFKIEVDVRSSVVGWRCRACGGYGIHQWASGLTGELAGSLGTDICCIGHDKGARKIHDFLLLLV